VTARLRAGDLDPAPRMAVIVQAMIEPLVAGIAMTGLDTADPDRAHIEAVRGRGDRLAGGTATPDEHLLSPADTDRIGELLDAAQAQLGCAAVDVEWVLAADRQLYLVQARPNTVRHLGHRDQPAVIRLYDDPLPADIPLGPIGPAVAHFVGKRRTAALLATELDLARGAAFVVYVPAGLQCGWRPARRSYCRFWAETAAEHVPLITGGRQPGARTARDADSAFWLRGRCRGLRWIQRHVTNTGSHSGDSAASSLTDHRTPTVWGRPAMRQFWRFSTVGCALR
jgi:hypothetical protein